MQSEHQTVMNSQIPWPESLIKWKCCLFLCPSEKYRAFCALATHEMLV